LEKFNKNPSLIKEMVELAANALKPFQFLAARLVHIDFPKEYRLTRIPISMDASSSAYKIMSYFLVEKDLASRTNLIEGDGNSIKD